MLFFFLLSHHHQIGFEKGVYITVHYGIDIARFLGGPHVFDQFIGMHDIVSDLRPPFDLHLGGFDFVAGFHLFSQFYLVQLRFEHFHRRGPVVVLAS